MKTNNIDIFLYVQSARTERSTAMTDLFTDMKGIVSASANQFVKRLVNVRYDPSKVNSEAIVKAAKREGDRVALVCM